MDTVDLAGEPSGRPRTPTRPTGSVRAAVVGCPLVLIALFACSCTGSGLESSAGPSPAATPSASTPPATQGPVEDPACAPGPGIEIEPLPDLTVAAIDVPPILDPSGQVLAPGATVPAQIVDAGCVIRHEASGGCVGAVDITSASIPPVVIPEQRAGDRVYQALTIAGAQRPGAHADEQCQVEQDGQVASVTRAGVVREGFARNGGARPGDDRVPTVRVPEVRMPDVDVDPVRLTRRELPNSPVAELEGSGRTSYVAPAEVLFAKDSAGLRSSAVSALRAIAREIRRTAPGGRLLVEGHTDDLGSAAHGLELSQQRADAVAGWLATGGGFDPSMIATKGWGEAKPAYPNDGAENRERNRRVVITVIGQ